MKTLQFAFDSGRYAIGDRELHCGDCFQIKLDGKWRDVRIEHSSRIKPPHSGWYLIGVPGEGWADLYEGKPVRLYDNN